MDISVINEYLKSKGIHKAKLKDIKFVLLKRVLFKIGRH